MANYQHGTTLQKLLQDYFDKQPTKEIQLTINRADRRVTVNEFPNEIFYFTKEFQKQLENFAKLSIGSPITVSKQMFSKIKGANQFGKMCGYAFEVAFWDSYCTAANLPYRDNPQCESKRARVNSYIKTYPQYAKAMKEIIERQYILAREALLIITKGSGRTLPELVLKMSKEDNAADDFILTTKTGDFQVYLDLTSLAAPRFGPAAWRHYSSRSDLSIGIMPLLTYIHYYEEKYWLMKEPNGDIYADAKWAEAIYNNKVVDNYFKHIGNRYGPENLLRRYMTKGQTDPNYLRNKGLIVATRHYGSAKGYHLEMTFDMDSLIDSAAFGPMTKGIPFYGVSSAYRWYNAGTDVDYAAVGIAKRDIEAKGVYNQQKLPKSQRSYGIAQAFALGKSIASL